MILTAILVIAFTLSVARGINKKGSLDSLYRKKLKQRQPEIEIVVPVKQEIHQGNKTIHLEDYLREKRKPRVVSVPLPDGKRYRIYEN